MDRQLQEIRDTWAKTGCPSFLMDGETKKTSPLINVIAVCLQRAMFLKVVDCRGIEKDAFFISTIIIDAIESVGPHNVVQIITNNAQVCNTAGLIMKG